MSLSNSPDEAPARPPETRAPRPLFATGPSADLIRDHPWAQTPLGDRSLWDEQLHAALDLILEAQFPMFLTWGEDDRFFYNDAFQSVVAGRGACMGRPVSEVLPEVWPDVRQLIAEVRAGRPAYREDRPVALVRGATVAPTWWSASYSPVRSAEGAIVGVLTVLYENTRRVIAEQALLKREAALVAVTDSAPALMWTCDDQGVLTWANQGMQAYFGLQTLGQVRWDDHVHADDIETAHAVYEESVRTGRPFACQQRLRGADGALRWFMIRAQRAIDADGVTSWSGTASDIDDWRASADSTSETEDLQRRFYESDATLMWVGDVATRQIEAFDPGSRRSWALPEDGTPIQWEDWIAFVDASDRPRLSALFDRAAKGEVCQARFRSVPIEGVVHRYHSTAFPMLAGADGAHRIGGMTVEVASASDARIYLVGPGATDPAGFARGLLLKGFKVRTFPDIAEFRDLAIDLAPGCVVLLIDVSMEPALALAAVLTANRSMPWIAVADFANRMPEVIRLMKLGAADILSRPKVDDVAAAAHSALASAFGKASESQPPSDGAQRLAQLTDRERQVFDGLIAGGTNKLIAKALDLSPRTVETHRANLMDKLGVSTLAELVTLNAEDAGRTD